MDNAVLDEEGNGRSRTVISAVRLTLMTLAVGSILSLGFLVVLVTGESCVVLDVLEDGEGTLVSVWRILTECQGET